MSSQPDMRKIAADRAALASRARLPWWFWALFTLATLGLVGSSVVAALTTRTIGLYAVLLPALLVYLLAERLARHLRGVQLSTKTLRDFPASRNSGIALLAIGVVGIVVVLVLCQHGQLAAAAVATVLTTAGIVAAMSSMQRGIRADITSGRARG